MEQPDICIIGSGAAGSFLLHALRKTTRTVLILEEGDNSPDFDATTFLDDIEIEGNHSFSHALSKQIGGSTNLWAGRVAPLEKVDFTRDNENSWPFDFDELIPFYNQTSEIMNISNYPYFKDARKQESNITLPHAINNAESFEFKKFCWSSPPYNTRAKILEPLLNKKSNFQLRQNAHITELIENEEQSKITAIKYMHNSIERKITPKLVILCAGGIENARILLNSQNISPKGIANKSDSVGRYFSTHPKADIAAMILKKPTSTKHPAFTDTLTTAGMERYGIGQKKNKKGDLNHYVQITPIMEYTTSKLFEKIKNTSAINSPFINKQKLLKGLLPGLGMMLYEILNRLSGLQRKASKFTLRAFLDQHPHPDNKLYLSDKEDQYGRKKINIQWKLHHKDKQSTLNFLQDLNLLIQKQNIGYIEYSGLKQLKEWPMTSIHSHFMGTTRMGLSEGDSVVDKNCKAHGYSNLFIAGPSVFRTYGYANPMYTIAALSLRLGNYIENERQNND